MTAPWPIVTPREHSIQTKVNVFAGVDGRANQGLFDGQLIDPIETYVRLVPLPIRQWSPMIMSP